jgi:hypothetical protein
MLLICAILVPPSTIKFMEQFSTIRLTIPTRAPAAFDHPDWVFELKLTGLP